MIAGVAGIYPVSITRFIAWLSMVAVYGYNEGMATALAPKGLIENTLHSLNCPKAVRSQIWNVLRSGEPVELEMKDGSKTIFSKVGATYRVEYKTAEGQSQDWKGLA
jgi:hypothetical protein